MVAQPIETAPKDGTKILVRHVGFMERTAWIEARWMDRKTFGYFEQDFDSEFADDLQPDLWCHLPEVPEDVPRPVPVGAGDV